MKLPVYVDRTFWLLLFLVTYVLFTIFYDPVKDIYGMWHKWRVNKALTTMSEKSVCNCSCSCEK